MTEALKALEAEVVATDQAAGVVPEGAQQPAPPGEPQATPQEEAAALVELAAAGLGAVWPELKYGEPTKTKAADKLAPLLAKYGASGGFFARWAAEIEAGVFFGTLIWQSVQQVRAVKAAAAEPKAGGDGGQ